MKKLSLLVICLVSISLLVSSGIILAEETYEVALILPGPRNDGGWCSTAYNGVKKAQEKYDFTFSYTENVTKSQQEEVFIGYAEDGYDLIIAHGFQFGDTAIKVGPRYEDIKFVVTSSDQHVQEPNVISTQINYREDGFMLGYIAALLTETNKVGFISGLELASIMLRYEYFEKGVNYYDPDVEVSHSCIGSFEDVNKAKESALVMINQGVDVLVGDANQASSGVALAAKTEDVLFLGANADQHALAPGTVVTSLALHWDKVFEVLIKKGINNNLEAKYYELGFQDDAISLAPFREFEDKLSEETKNQIYEMVEKIEKGEFIPRNLE